MAIIERMKKLTIREASFVKHFLETGNATEAYRRSYSTAGMLERTIGNTAYKVSNKPHVKAEIERLRGRAAEIVAFREADVLRHWVEIATADPNDLVRYRRVCCRHCYGAGGRFQWRDEDEWARAVAEFTGKPELTPSDVGGYGFNPTLPPVPSCPMCFGEGHGEVHVADTAKVMGAAKRLYAGAKQTRDGIQILFRDQDAALANIAKYLGMLDREPTKADPAVAAVTALAALAEKLPG